jgi:Uma2 family endonuclease
MSTLTMPTMQMPQVQEVPTHLIYEMADGPIYYQGYQDVLHDIKKAEEIMGSSFLQSFLISLLIRFLIQHLPETYIVLTNELGLQLPGGKWRAADIAIYHQEQLQGIPLHNHYIDIAPQVVIEVDTQADLTQFSTPMDYYYTKTDALLDFGVNKVIWIFTDARKVMVAEKERDWITRSWDSSVDVLNGIAVNPAQLIKQYLP